MNTIRIENFLKKKCIILVILILSQPIYPHTEDKKSKVLANVGTHKIFLSDFETRYTDYLISTGINDNILVRKSILNNMINEILLYYYDSNESIFNNVDYNKELERAKVRTILSYMMDQEIYANIHASEEELREAFIKTNEKIAVRHLFAHTEEEANNLYELLKIGVSFESLAKQVFTDSALKNTGGYLGYNSWGDLDPSFEDAVSKLKIGEISKPVATAFGFSIIRLEDRVRNPLLTEYDFNLKKSHLERAVKINKKLPYEKEFIKNILIENELSFNEEALKNIMSGINKSLDIESPVKNVTYPEAVKYQDKIFSQREIEKKILQLPSYHLEKINSINTLKAAIKGILINEIIYNMALEKGYDSAPAVLKTIEKYKLNLFLKFKGEEVASSVSLEDSILWNYYNEYIHLFTTENEINVREIVTDNKNLAGQLFDNLTSGEDFSKIAKEHSLRNWSADNEGELGYLPSSMFGDYNTLLWETDLGKVIGPYEIDNYYYIFKVVGKNEGKPIPFEEIKPEVSNLIKNNTRHLIMRDYIENLYQNINIQVDENMLASYNING